ncbi:MAG: FMN-binding protein [Epulopiscium sp. Nuni2H_MBin003]|nr:MAG: FMN-binding protein [Epulopiscium sp. Nuni2H_MBin003]
MVKNTAILTIITLCAGLFLGLVFEITKEPIAIAKETAKQQAYQEVFSAADSFIDYAGFSADEARSVLDNAGLTSDSIVEVVEATSSGEVLGHVITVTAHDGYAGDITFTIGITLDGNINGIAILTIGETPGLGMKAAEDGFTSQFGNKSAQQFVVTKTGSTSDGEIDAIGGATITTVAMVNGVNAGLEYWEHITGGISNE